MAGNSTPLLVGAVRNKAIKMSTAATDDNGSGSTLLFTADATNGSRIHALSATPTATLSAAVVIRFFLEEAGTYWLLGEKTIPAYTEATGVAAPTTSFLEYADMPFLDPADRFLALGPGQQLFAALLVAPTNPIHIVAQGGDY